ncbi:MAG: hypothetical protein DMD34_11825 [Gemmatimonadetes bacterium]|nr:MAG: hypothetical protein DMD34_11825 [Gemmatimonadota bacterium]
MRLAFPVAPLALLTLAAIPATAQETPAEKTAAADVIRRMGELERSLALPPLVARLAGARDPRRDAVIARARDLMDRELLAMADDITRHPETGWKEERSVKILADYLTAHGFAVEMGVAGLKTAFVARYTKGTPSSSTTRCAAPAATSTATSTAPRGPSGSPRPSPCRSSSRARKRPAR